MAGYEREGLEDRIAERRRNRRALERQRHRTFMRRRITALAALAVIIAAPFAIFGKHDRSHAAAAASTATAPATALVTTPHPADSLAAVAKKHSHPTPTVTNFRSAVPVLLYHVIHAAPIGAPLPGLFVPRHELAQQLRWLDHNGYQAVTLDQVFAAWQQGAPIPQKPIVISFDDGYATQYRNAAPLLARHGWPGVLNLKIDSLRQQELTEDMVKEMIAAGWEVDSHTFTHPDVTTLDAAGLLKEIAGSRRYLQRHFNIPVNFFCYPAGAFNDLSVAAVKAAGYIGATTTVEGLATPDADPFELSRVRIEPGDGAVGLQQKLADAGATS